jgi:acetyltransferase-like isoleucine patch superfamily enzyme
MIIQKIIRKLKIACMSNEQYIEYLRARGVTIGQACEIHKEVIFGSEPYLITIGNHVRITRGVKLVTHDGGLWVLRGGGKSVTQRRPFWQYCNW